MTTAREIYNRIMNHEKTERMYVYNWIFGKFQNAGTPVLERNC